MTETGSFPNNLPQLLAEPRNDMIGSVCNLTDKSEFVRQGRRTLRNNRSEFIGAFCIENINQQRMKGRTYGGHIQGVHEA